MCRFLSTLVLLAAGVLAVGLCRDWLSVSATEDVQTDQVDINLRIDKARIKADARTAKERALDLREDLRELLEDPE